MTTKPTARKFRIRRPGAVSAARPAAPSYEPGPRTDDGFGSEPFPTAAAADRRPAEQAQAPQAAGAQSAAARQTAPDQTADSAAPDETMGDMAAGSGLTSRQLRMARRLAHRHGLDPKGDAEAVEMLRARGINPFDRSNMLELVVADGEAPAITPNLPEPIREQPRPNPALSGDRAREIQEIQRDIAQRRRRKMTMLGARLLAFVLIPTLLVGYYFFNVATPMYATKSEFVIQQAEAQSAGLGGLFSGTGLATSQDSITVQSYLGSRESMLRLDKDIGYKSHFSQPFIDPIQRLEPDATNEQAYKHYVRHVKIGYDPTEGIIKMEVIAADPEVSAAFSRALITYAEEQVDTLSLRLREDQMRGATESFREAEAKMEEAQERVLALQEQLGVLDPASESASVMGQVSAFEQQISEKRLQLSQLLDNPVPNQARVAGIEGDIARLQNLIAELRSQLTTSNTANGSLASVTSRLQMAEVDLQTRTMMMQEALQHLESARVEANRQVRYLSTGVNPIPPDESTYPRAAENTALAFVVFLGIYLMLSLTASILRDQVST